MRALGVLLLVTLLGAAAGCGALQSLAPCQDDSDCRATERCREGGCVPRPPPAKELDAGPVVDAGPVLPPLPLALHAIRPPLARHGDRVVLEGAFSGAPRVFFPGVKEPVVVPAGSRTTRLEVTVPDGATTGMLHVAQDGAESARLPVVITRLGLRLGAFGSQPEQALAARELPPLLAPRAGHVAVTRGRYLHVIGGRGEASPTATVERARVYADDTLGPFEAAPTSLSLAREDAALVEVQDRVYVLGGTSEGAFFPEIEVATFDDEGALGSFALSSEKLNEPRAGAAAIVLGRSLYVIGGRSHLGELASIERAYIRDDGSLAPFETLSMTLVHPRSGHAVVATPGALFVLGGGEVDPAGVERIALDEQGELSEGFVRVNALAEPRSHARVLALGGEICLVGGLVGGPSQVTPAGRLLCAARRGADDLAPFVPSARHLVQARGRHALTRVGRRVYVSGGGGAGPSARLEQASLVRATGLGAFSLVEESALSTPRRAMGCAVIGDYLYVMGGYDGGGDLGSIERAPIDARGELGPFERHRALGSSRRALRLAVVRGRVYAVGGIQGTAQLTAVSSTRVLEDGSLAGDFAAHSTLNTERAGAGLAVVGERLYALGGRTSEGDTAAGEQALIGPGGLEATWSLAPSLTEPRSFHAALVLGEHLYALGGRNGPVASTTFEAAPFVPDARVARVDGFLAAGALPEARATHGAVAGVGALFLIGGGTVEAPAPSTTSVLLDDDGRPAAEWTTAPGSVPAEGVANGCVVSLGDFVYVVGGADALAGTPSSAVYRAVLEAALE